MTFVEFLIWPFLAALLMLALRKSTKVAAWANLVFNLAWAILLCSAWNSKPGVGLEPIIKIDWLPMFKSHFELAVDGLSEPLIILNVFLSLVLALYSLSKDNLSAGYHSLFWILNGASVGSLMATDAFTFYVFWEFMLIPLYFLIGIWGGKNRVYASLKFFAFTMGGSLLMLGSILALAYNTAIPSLSWSDIAANKIAFEGIWAFQGLVFLGFLISFLVKIPLWPLHSWLPDAHSEAPTGGSVILAGVLLKLGVYGIARWCLPLFPESAIAVAPVIMILSLLGIVIGAFAAWKQTDVKRMIAYSSVSHMGFIVLGLFAFGEEGLKGALFQNLAHGLSTGALFLIFGIMYDRTHTRLVKDYGGVATKAGVLASLFVFAGMASIGLPGLPGFIGEFLILVGTFFKTPWVALVAMSGVLLGAIYTLTFIKNAMFGPTSKVVEDHPIKLVWSEWAAVFALSIAMLVLGLQPNGILKHTTSAVETTLKGLR